MKVTVKLFATFRQGREKLQIMDIKEGTTPKDIIERLDINLETVSILLINGKNGELNSKLTESDVLSLFPPIGSG